MFRQKVLTKEQQAMLKEALYYLKMAELRKACEMLSLPYMGKKIDLINRITTYVQTGKTIEQPTTPPQSQAKNYPAQPLSPKALMLQGSYKNDAKTRAYFEQLIGPHFHFTAYGIDWLNERLLQGNPPTYQEFTDYWVQETARREQTKEKPKAEWMLIRFMQQMSNKYPQLSKQDLTNRWKQVQAQQVSLAFEILKSIIKK